MDMQGSFNLKPKYDQCYNKSFYLLKLTDFAQKLLNNCSQTGTNQIQISLKFLENQGIIKVLPSMNDTNEKEIDLRFTIQDMAVPTEGAFECTKFKKSAFNSMGLVKQKFIINAKDDIYATTREKMAMAEEKNKLNRAKEIKMPKLVGKKASSFKAPTKFNSILNARSLPSDSSNHEKFKANSTMEKPIPTYKTLNQIMTNPEQGHHKPSAHPDSVNEPKKVNLLPKEANKPLAPPSILATPLAIVDPRKKVSAIIRSTPPPATSNAWPNGKGAGVSHVVAPLSQNNVGSSGGGFKPIPFTFDKVVAGQQSTSPTTGTEQATNDATLRAVDFNLKDIVIHTLALRPYKRSEMIQKLEKDHPTVISQALRNAEPGLLSSNDANTISGNGQQIASLLTGILNSVAVFNMKNSAYLLARHGFAEIQLDWPLYNENERAYVKRKMPASSSPKPIDNAKTPPHLKHLKVGTTSIPPCTPNTLAPIVDVATSNKPTHLPPPKHGNGVRSPKVISGEIERGVAEKSKAAPTDKPLLGDEKRLRIDNLEHAPPANKDYLNLYPAISSRSQRQSYKEIFDSEYQEYLTLHKKLQAVWSKFCKMEAHLNSLAHENSSYKETKARIIKEYKDTVNSESHYSLRRKRFDYLHAKLSHIKHMVATYDSKHTTKKGDANTNNLNNCHRPTALSQAS